LDDSVSKSNYQSVGFLIDLVSSVFLRFHCGRAS